MIILAGYYWTENVGDMVLREAARSMLGPRLNSDLWAGHLGEWLSQPGGPDWRQVEAVVLPGGGLFQDIGGWDPAGWGLGSSPAVFWGSVVVEAVAHGVPVVAWANGFGPLSNKDALAFSRGVYAMTSYRSWRDPASALLADVGGATSGDLALTQDIELSLEPNAPVAVSLRSFPGDNEPEKTETAVRDFLGRLRRPVVVVPFDRDDSTYVDAFSSLDDVTFVSPQESWRAKLKAFRQCGGVVTNRYHATLFGLASGVPVLAFPSGDSKIASALSEFGSSVHVEQSNARNAGALEVAWQAAVSEVGGSEGARRRFHRSALAGRILAEAEEVARVLARPPEPTSVEPLLRVLLESIRSRTEALLAEKERSAETSRRQTEALLAEKERSAEATREAAAAALRADELYRQVREIQASTAWRWSAPVRAMGTVRRNASRMLPFLNARRVRAALHLAVRGDVRTLRQRLEATMAVTGGGGGTLRQSGGRVVHKAAEPWPIEQPLVSVVIPCFNYGAYVDEAIGSVLGQTLGTRVECIVVDGGSTDEATRRRMRQLADSPPERTQVLLRTDGRHLVGDNRNYGITRARGKYICCLDADDVLDPIYLEMAVFLAERYSYGVVSTATRCFGTVRDTFGLLAEPVLSDMLLANNVTTVAVYPRALWEEAGGYQDSGLGAEHIHEDWRLWVRMAALGARIHNITGSELFNYRVHSSESLSNQQGLRDLQWQREAIAAANADVVTPAALEESRVARDLDVIVDGALDNLAAANDDRPGVLLCLPFLVVGGAERLLSAVSGHLVEQGFRVVVVTTAQPPAGAGDSTTWFTQSTDEVFHLPKLLARHRWLDFMDHLVRSKGISVLVVAGSAVTYELLPELKRTHPRLRVVDVLFNTEGHVANNRKFAHLIDLHLCENSDVEEWLVTQGEPGSKVLRVESGIDLDAYRPQRISSRGGVLTIGYSGRLSEEKDPLAFVRMARAARHPRLRFVMTGAGPMESEVRRAVERSHGAVTFLGQVEDIKSHMASLDLLVVPSRLDGRPMAVLEALALGVPVLASRVGGLPELILEGKTGWTVAPGAIDAFAQRLLALADHPETLENMRAAARAYAEQVLDARLMFARYEAALREVIVEAR